MYPILFDACHNCGPAQKNSSNLTCDSNQTIFWILHLFHECVDTPKEEIGFILGLISISCWICASVPQLVENYRKKHVEEAISFLFLMFWLFGDSSNLVGCLLTGQLPIQIVTAVYYVFMDIVMVLQYLYYRARNRIRAKRERDAIVNDLLVNGNNPKHVLACLCLIVVVPLTLIKRPFYSSETLLTSAEHVRVGRTLLSTGSGNLGHPLFPADPEEIIGYVIGCISSIFYLCSRLPQILKNYRRHATEGVSIHMFILAVMGNALYGSSILLQDPNPGHTYTQFVIFHLPWLIGSLGTMSLDFTLLLQIIYYDAPCKRRPQATDDVEPLLA